MGAYVNGHLIYGFINNDKTKDLFKAIFGPNEDRKLHRDLQTKYKLSFYSAGYIETLTAFEANAYSKNFDDAILNAADLAKTDEYKSNITSFLQELEIDTEQWKPEWHLMSYID